MASGSITDRIRTRKRDGSTYKVWRAQLPDPVRGGARKIERTFQTKREAERWMTTQRSAVQRGEWIDPAEGRKTFAEVGDEWHDKVWADLAPRTQQAYESLLRQINGHFGQAQVAAIHTAEVQEYVNGLATTRSAATIRRYFVVLTGVLRLAVERRYVATNPCDSVRLPRRQRGVREEQLFLEPEEVASLAEAIDPHYRVAIYVAAYTGLRAGELWALRRDDIDLLRGTLRVDEALKDVNGHLQFGEPKSEKSRRTFALPAAIRDLLADHLSVPTPAGTGPTSLIFTTPRGTPIRHNNFYKRTYKPAVEGGTCAAEGCGGEVRSGAEECPECGSEELRWVLAPAKHRLRFHDLRHTCASLSLSVAPDLFALSRRLGHEDIKTTANTYGHLLPNVDAALAAELNALFTDTTTRPEAVAAIR